MILGWLRGVVLDPTARLQASELCYDVVWKASEVATAAAQCFHDNPTDHELAAVFNRLAERHNLQVYDNLLPALDRLSAIAIGNASGSLVSTLSWGAVFPPPPKPERSVSPLATNCCLIVCCLYSRKRARLLLRMKHSPLAVPCRKHEPKKPSTVRRSDFRSRWRTAAARSL